MKRIFLPISIVCLALVSLTATVYAQTKTFSINPEESKLEYSFKSTLHPVHGVAHQFSGNFLVDDTAGLDVKSGRVVVDSKQLDSRNKKRDRNMYDMLDVLKFPKINYAINQFVEIRQTVVGSYRGVLKGALIIKDVTKDVDVNVNFQETDNGYFLEGECEISLKMFDLNPPSVLGLIKVSDPVTIHFQIQLN